MDRILSRLRSSNEHLTPARFGAIPGDEPFYGVFIAPPGVLRGERIEHRRLGLFQFRDGQRRRTTDRFGLLFWNHWKRLLFVRLRSFVFVIISAQMSSVEYLK